MTPLEECAYRSSVWQSVAVGSVAVWQSVLQLPLTKHLPCDAAVDSVPIHLSVTTNDVPCCPGRSQHSQSNAAKKLYYMDAVT